MDNKKVAFVSDSTTLESSLASETFVWEEYVQQCKQVRKQKNEMLETKRNSLRIQEQLVRASEINTMISKLTQLMESEDIPKLAEAQTLAYKYAIERNADVREQLQQEEFAYLREEDAYEQTANRFDDV